MVQQGPAPTSEEEDMIQVLIAPIAVLAFGLAVGNGPGHHGNGHGHHDAYYDDGVVMFSHAGFRGEALVTDESIRNLRRFDFNNDVSSMYVPRGFEVTFYGKQQFRGRSFTVEGPARLRRLGCAWNDRISSIEIIERCGTNSSGWHGSRDDDRRSVDRPRAQRKSDRVAAPNKVRKTKQRRK
jgi:hypothetical protein